MSVQVRAYLTDTFANRIDSEYLQEGLLKLGYHPGGVDGRFGISTMRAVVAFQNDNKLEPNGHADPPTWEAFEKALNPPKAKTKPAPAEKAEAEPTEPATKKAAPKKAAPKKVAAKKG